jgi:hypothetical protein
MGRVNPGPPRTPRQWVRAVGNAVNLSTALGLLAAVVGRADLRPGPGGLVLAEHYRLPFPVASAFTVGNVILTSGRFEELLRTNPHLLEHEERHTWQYLACLGLPFYALYGICTVWSLARTGDRAARNLFERLADLADGGYVDYPVRPVAENLRALLRRPGSRAA